MNLVPSSVDSITEVREYHSKPEHAFSGEYFFTKESNKYFRRPLKRTRWSNSQVYREHLIHHHPEYFRSMNLQTTSMPEWYRNLKAENPHMTKDELMDAQKWHNAYETCKFIKNPSV